MKYIIGIIKDSDFCGHSTGVGNYKEGNKQHDALDRLTAVCQGTDTLMNIKYGSNGNITFKTGAFIMMYNELSHKYIVRRTIKIKTPAQIPFDMNPATDANISLEIKISIQELHYPNGDLTINGYATACNSGNLNITTSLDMNIVMDSDVRNVTFKRQYFGFELSQKGFIPIGEVHENIYNISSYKHIDVNLHPHWAVFNGSLGNVVPTIPGTFNLIPVEYITSKQYRIK
ncbi:MAG: hypothetical protein J5610_06315 [Prevotella sp.]|nr:hypothetical protein [Prevotella sp.]